MRLLPLSALLAFGVTCAANVDGKCNGVAEGSADYNRAADVVRQLPEYQAWSRSHSFPVAFGSVTDKKRLVGGKCYWSVSVYADRPDRLELWRVFLVRRSSSRVLIENIDGEPIPLATWRKQSTAPMGTP